MTNRIRGGRLQAALIALVVLIAGNATLRAHDPGLSALDVHVGDERITASLSIAAADVVLIASNGSERREVGELAADAIRVSIDGAPAKASIDSVDIDGGAARVVMSFPITTADAPRHLQLVSDIAKRMARGHRELVTIARGDRIVAERLVDATSGAIVVELESSAEVAWSSAARFLTLGVRHILSGYDHLVFLVGLLLASRKVRELVACLTAFTAAHSVTLALAATGAVHAPASIVEPLIAASIAWIGLENLFAGRLPPSRAQRAMASHAEAFGEGGKAAPTSREPAAGPRRARWLVVFGFGLIHGFGFAEALRELGLGSSPIETAIALLSFNGGVELGQLAVAGVLLPFVWAMRARPQWSARLVPACSAVIVVAGGYWLLDRLR